MTGMSRFPKLLFLLVLVAVSSTPGAAQVKTSEKTLSKMMTGDVRLPSDSRIPGDDPRVAAKIGRDLAILYAEYDAHRKTRPARAFSPSNPLLRLKDDLVLIDAVAEGDTMALQRALEGLGLVQSAAYGSIVSGRLPIPAIADLPSVSGLRFVRPSYPATGTGGVTTQGDPAMATDFARLDLAVDGAGTTVGTLSDSYDCLGGAAGEVATLDLPAGVVVLDDTACPESDEGRAMMQIVADVAPGASQGFHTAFNGQADFALGIEELAGCPPGSALGCSPVPGFAADVIVDDVFYPTEPFFQDGIIAQAVDRVVAAGVSYFALAGNHSRKSYQEGFVPSGLTEPMFGGELHDFDPGPGVDALQSITVPVGATVRFSFQWDQPYFSVSGAPGSASDHDIFVFDATGGTVLASGATDNVGGDPIEVFSFTNDGSVDVDGTPGPDTSFNLAISNFFGPHAGTLKYIALVNGALSAFTVNEFDTASGTIYGHMNAAGAETVGAAFYFKTPSFGTNPALLESFSSAGPLIILFDAGGASTLDLRGKPDLVAPDGGNNTFFGSDIPDPGDGSDTDTFPNFFGTSAAAPHAAGVAALMMETGNLTPLGVRQVMAAAALDMGTPGFDVDTGDGFLLGLFALDSTVAPANWTGGCGVDELSLAGTPNDGPQTFRACDTVTAEAGAFDQVTLIAGDGVHSGTVILGSGFSSSELAIHTVLP